MKKLCIAVLLLVLALNTQSLYATAPDISLDSLIGAPVSAESLKSGNRKILFFWASWCHFCQRELENLPAHLEFMKKNNIELIAVNVNESTATVQRYKEKSGFPYPIVLDAQGTLSDSLSILGIPTFVYFAGVKELDRTNYFSPVQARQIFKIEDTSEDKKGMKK